MMADREVELDGQRLWMAGPMGSDFRLVALESFFGERERGREMENWTNGN